MARFAREHMSVRYAAHMLRCSPTTVLKARQAEEGYWGDDNGTISVHNRLGLDGKRRPDRRCDNTDRDAEIRALRADWKPIRVIAAEVGCSVGTVHRVLHA
jgi:hypothetical protein